MSAATTGAGGGPLLAAADHDLLLSLLRTATVAPAEAAGAGADPARADPAGEEERPRLWEAQRAYARAAAAFGMRVVRHAPPPATALERLDVPAAVRSAVAADPGFLTRQPSLVLRLGPPLPPASTVMFNVHLDTVSGLEPVGFDGERFTGRGAVDAKGPAVALLAGVRAAAAADPAVGRDVAVLVQAVSGEEGGAMGTWGTRPLVEAGHVGRLNVFCEPTGLRSLPRATAAATARLTVEGAGAVDDRPAAGHNATVLLGYLAQHLAHALDSRTGAAGAGRTCVAGLHTGDAHNRVYGRGRLLLNTAYASAAEGARAERVLSEAVRTGVREFADRFAGSGEYARTAADAARITRLEWDKRGLPCLDNADPWAEALLAAAGAGGWPAHEPAFTCDAIWMQGVPGAFTTVLGPGTLEGNRAHAPGEFVRLAELEAFAGVVARLLAAFAARYAEAPAPPGPAPAPSGPVPAPPGAGTGSAHGEPGPSPPPPRSSFPGPHPEQRNPA